MSNLKNKRILIIGGNGLLGRPLQELLIKKNINFWAPRSSELNVLQKEYMDGFFNCYRPEVVFNLFVSYGGIVKNAERPGSIFYDNLIGNVNVVECCKKWNVEKLIQIGTQCSYADKQEIPFKEDNLWDGYPTENNAPYGVAKRMLHTMLKAYKQEYGLNSIYIIPSNMYGGLGENWHPEHSHVIPSLIRRIVDAKDNSIDKVEIWGTGENTREFLYNFDAADAVIKAAEVYDDIEPVNIGSGRTITIRQLANTIKDIVGYTGELWFNNNQNLGGQQDRLNSIERAKSKVLWEPATNIETGLRQTINYYRNNKALLREVHIYE